MNKESIVNQIASFSIFSEVPRNQIEWMVNRGRVESVKAGDYYTKKGDPIDKLQVLLSGSLSFKREQNGQFKEVFHLEVGEISGLLPYSRAQSALGYGMAVMDSEMFVLDKDHFRDLICECHELTSMLVHHMTDRVRDFTRFQQQNEKLMALGKLSAGLAHELNNPASAIVRSSESLEKHLGSVPEKFKKVISMKISHKQVDLLNTIMAAKSGCGVNRKESLMVRTQREEEITDWLEENGYGDHYLLAETLADFDFGAERLSQINEGLDKEMFPKVMAWIDNMLTTERMVSEIKEASRRISSLVNSIKSYSNMDRSNEKELTDIHEGIHNTLVILNHKIKTHNIKIEEELDGELPKIKARPGELNQVWTNIIDNALDAMESTGGELKIKTSHNGEMISVQIIDSGVGIAEDIQDRIFEPFFTTKDIGKGTGLGLDVVHRIIQSHDGSISLESSPGRTKFEFCLPINQ